MPGITDPTEEYFKDGVWGWDSTAEAWIKVTASSGKLQVETVSEAHAATHQNGGDDEINVTGLNGELADDQPPKTHAATHQNGGADEINVAGLDGELADNQPPKAHAADHKDGAADELDASELAGALGDANEVLTSDGSACSWEAAAAAVDTLCRFGPLHNEPPSSNPATLDTRNYHPVLDFDDTTNESAVFSDTMPRHYAGNGVTVTHYFTMTTATADTIDVDGAFERIGTGQQDLDTDGFASVQSTDNTTVAGTSGLTFTVTIAFTDGAQMDSIAAGEPFRYKVTRDAASDDATGDAELVRIEIKNT